MRPLPGVVAAFRPDDAILRERRERSTDRGFAFASGVEVGGVDMPHPGGNRRLHEVDVLGCARESICAEPDPGDLGAGQAELR